MLQETTQLNVLLECYHKNKCVYYKILYTPSQALSIQCDGYRVCPCRRGSWCTRESTMGVRLKKGLV